MGVLSSHKIAWSNADVVTAISVYNYYRRDFIQRNCIVTTAENSSIAGCGLSRRRRENATFLADYWIISGIFFRSFLLFYIYYSGLGLSSNGIEKWNFDRIYHLSPENYFAVRFPRDGSKRTKA